MTSLRKVPLVVAAFVLLSGMLPAEASAQLGSGPRRPSVRLALLRPVVEVEADARARRALETLGATVARRTSVEISTEPPAVLHPLDPRLFEHPLVVLAGDAPWREWTEEERATMQAYLALGGMVVVDDRSGRADSPFAAHARRELARAVGGRAFVPVPEDHALQRAYYLLERAWGRVDVSEQLEMIELDGRAAVVLSLNDLTGAMARDQLGQWSLTVEPGGRRQRELALRQAVNTVLYALTLDYKEDLVHLPHILERRR